MGDTVKIGMNEIYAIELLLTSPSDVRVLGEGRWCCGIKLIFRSAHRDPFGELCTKIASKKDYQEAHTKTK